MSIPETTSVEGFERYVGGKCLFESHGEAWRDIKAWIVVLPPCSASVCGVRNAGWIGIRGALPSASSAVRRRSCDAATSLCWHSQCLGRRYVPRLCQKRGTAGGRDGLLTNELVAELITARGPETRTFLNS